MRIFSLFFKKLCQISIVYWNVTTVNIEPFFSCHSENITVDTHTPNDMSMGTHKTPGEGGGISLSQRHTFKHKILLFEYICHSCQSCLKVERGLNRKAMSHGIYCAWGRVSPLANGSGGFTPSKHYSYWNNLQPASIATRTLVQSLGILPT